MMMIHSLPPSTPTAVLSQQQQVEVFGVPQVFASEKEQQKKQRRRRRRRNNNNKISHPNQINVVNNNSSSSNCSDDSSTCATVSSDSTGSSSSHQRLDLAANCTTNKQHNCNKNGSCTTNSSISLAEQAKYVALDCEMVGVGYTGRRSSVARVTVVAWDGSILLDEFVQQTEEVTDYRTFVSGITASDLEATTFTLPEIQTMVQNMLQDKILVGHALKNDLRVLGITHPWYNIRDTAKYEQFMQVRPCDGNLWPRKLSDLVKTRLHRDIQQPGVPHSSYEDAVAAMDLYKLVRRKWEMAMEYKLQKTLAIEQQKGSNNKTVTAAQQQQ